MTRPVRLGLTPRQRETLNFIEAFTENHGYAPSYEEIAKGIGLTSKNTVHYLVHRLEERGCIHLSNKSRSIAIVRSP